MTAADADENADEAHGSSADTGDGSEVDGRLLLKRARERGSTTAPGTDAAAKRSNGRKIVVGERSTEADVAPDEQESNGEESSKMPGGATKKTKGPQAAAIKAPKAPPMEAKDIKVLSFAELMEKKRQNKE